MEIIEKPKRTISPEQKEKMRLGKIKAKEAKLKAEAEPKPEVATEQTEPEEQEYNYDMTNINKIIEEEEAKLNLINEEASPKAYEVATEPTEKKKITNNRTRERMLELNKIKTENAYAKMKVKEEIKELKKKKYNHELEMALKLKEKLEKETAKMNKIKEEKETNNLIISSSTEALKKKYLEEAKKRILNDLFS